MPIVYQFNKYSDFRLRLYDIEVGDGVCFNVDGLKKYYLQDTLMSASTHGRFQRRTGVSYCWKGGRLL